MTIMSGDFGADARLVAFTQYLRVLVVSMVAVGVARVALTATPDPETTKAFWLAVGWGDLMGIIGVIALGLLITRLTNLPGGLILIPLVLGVLAENFFGLNIAPPPWIMIPAYAVMGWKVGLTFDRETVIRTLKMLPAVVLAILALIAACGLFAVAMVYWGGIDPLTAYLASSPGGLDAVTIIASASGADLPLVMAMQSCRLLIVIMTAPSLARWISQKKLTGSDQ
jgi:membrane AbrB-like protein